MYQLLYHPRTEKFLKKISQKELSKIILKLERLRKDPNNKNLNIKKLATTQKSYRLRLGNIRVIYELDKKNKIIYIHDIDFRGNIY